MTIQTKVAIVGMGSSGQSAAKLALASGYSVYCIDRKNVSVPDDCIFTLESKASLDGISLVVVSPGVPSHNSIIQSALDNNIPIISELNFASRQLKVPMIAVTGTNGKSSTVWYTKQIAEQCGLHVFLGGNFGCALSEMVLDIIDNGTHYDLAIVEVSSYQMEWSQDFHPKAACLLNLTPDHLARHGTLEEYKRCKLKLFGQQQKTDLAVLPLLHTDLHPHIDTERRFFGHLDDRSNEYGCFFSETKFQCFSPSTHWSLSRSEIPLLGDHNLDNVAAAVLLLEPFIDNSMTPSFLPSLDSLEHRLERFSVGNREWINDSKATNIEATQAALQSMIQPVTILLGGAGKQGADYTQLVDLLQKKTTQVICFGASGPEIYSQLNPILSENISCTTTVDLSSAIQLARLKDDPRPVLLSPACASFDAFNNFEHRGRYFKEILLASEVV